MTQTSIALQPGRWLVNFIPIREWGAGHDVSSKAKPWWGFSTVMYVPVWFPGAGFQRWAKNAKEQFFKMTRTPFNQVKLQMVNDLVACV